MLVPVLFLLIFGIVIAVAFFSAISIRVSGGSRPQHLRHRIYEDTVTKPQHEVHQDKLINEKSEEVQQDDYDDFFKEYDDFFEQDDDPFNEKK